jgi:hypothetical protein
MAHNTSSWPGLTRPSTSFLSVHRESEGVDHRTFAAPKGYGPAGGTSPVMTAEFAEMRLIRPSGPASPLSGALFCDRSKANRIELLRLGNF